MEVGARRIRSEKLREDQYKEACVRSLEGKRVGDGDNVKHMWEHVKRAMVESAKEVWRVGGKEPKEFVVYN